MRIVVKGGVWKNTEDEILKAAISKYGKNQWARISSLLVRKTPKQCKARWYEWLDPSIKKTEWSTAEDEKLLHLAKLMPTQWRTIAPIVGRTANQCLERYQKLLDAAEAKEDAERAGELGFTGEGSGGPSADDVRRLRPGEVDPDPEARPARPDPIDMDEDEKEMLSEARARLANTQGKKAKRKARERQLEEARRLAMLQKKRELKAAGIIMRPRLKKGDMDYMADIPFEKKPAPGFYDTSEEAARQYSAPIGKTLRALEAGGKRQREDPGEEQRKRQKKAQDKSAQGDNFFVPAKDNQIRKLKEKEQISRRGKLVLPEPQVGEQELEEIVKIGKSGETARNAVIREGEDEDETALLGDYTPLDRGREIRTQRTEQKQDSVMTEARNLLNMTVQQTPLLGEENTPLHDLPGRGTGFEGATPRNGVAATPNPLATPFRRDASTSDGASTFGGAATSQLPLRTPRDSFGINEPTPSMVSGVEETPREARMRMNEQTRALKRGFAALPKAKNDFEFAFKDEEDTVASDDIAPKRVEDASERDERERRERDELEKKELGRRSQPVKLGLPRPAKIDLSSLYEDAEDDVEKMVLKEMQQLMIHDSLLHPVAGSSKKKNAAMATSKLLVIPDDQLLNARDLVRKELGEIVGFPGGSEDAIKRALLLQLKEDPELDSALETAWLDSRSSLAWSSAAKSWVPKETLSGAELELGQEELLEMAREKMGRDASKAAKLEKKMNTLLGGYQARFSTLKDRLTTADAEAKELFSQVRTFEYLRDGEQGAMERRREGLEKLVKGLEIREREGQIKWSELNERREMLKGRLEELQLLEAEDINERALAAMET
ncbi:hypothetical protein BT69DRAFT_1312106 [Atractiella rhizophila]|nr:hypothetical protein BT69DRAFT_1312106 [Atractiella rhizophila]